MACALEKNNNDGSKRVYKWACKCYQFFRDVNSISYSVTNFLPKAGILLKLINVFCSENLALLTVTEITKSRNSETSWKVGNKRCKAERGSNR